MAEELCVPTSKRASARRPGAFRSLLRSLRFLDSLLRRHGIAPHRACQRIGQRLSEAPSSVPCEVVGERVVRGLQLRKPRRWAGTNQRTRAWRVKVPVCCGECCNLTVEGLANAAIHTIRIPPPLPLNPFLASVPYMALRIGACS